MSKYYLAIDKKHSKDKDKSDRFKIIEINDLNSNFENNIHSIIDYTKLFNDEDELKKELLQKGLIDKEDLDRHFTICYKSPKNAAGINVWKKCGKYDKESSGILFKNNAYLFDPYNFTNELYSLELNQGAYFDYLNCSNEEKIHYHLMEMLCKEIINNKFYEFDYIDYKARDILQYLYGAKENGYVNSHYKTYVYELVSTLCYKYDKFDINKEYPLKNKKNEIIFNERHFYELVIYYANIKNNFYKEYLEKQKEANDKSKDLIRIRKPIEGTQITFDEILKG